MQWTQTEQDLLDQAQAALTKIIGLEMRIIHEPQINHTTRVDAEIWIQHRDHEYGPWYAEIKRTILKGALGVVVEQLKRGPQPGLLITRYVNPKNAERLYKLGQQFIDAVGNVYLEEDNLVILVTGKPNNIPKQLGDRPRQFRPTELKLIFLFICDQEAVAMPYRELAKRADIALGNVAETIKELRTQGFLVTTRRRKRQLVRQKELIERWVTDYITRLRPTLVIGRYQPLNPKWWQTAKLKEGQDQWGGEVAAAHWTNYLKPGTATIYVDRNPADLVLQYRLTKHEGGNTEILKRFWPRDLTSSAPRYVPPLIAYADLLAIGGPRNIETATNLYETRIAQGYQ